MLKKVWWVHLSHHLPLLVPRLSSWWRQGTPSSLPPSPPPYDNHFHFHSNLAQWLRPNLLVKHHRQFDFILKHSKHVGGAGWEGINVFWWQGFSNKYVLDDNSQWRQRCSLNGRDSSILILFVDCWLATCTPPDLCQIWPSHLPGWSSRGSSQLRSFQQSPAQPECKSVWHPPTQIWNF